MTETSPTGASGTAVGGPFVLVGESGWHITRAGFRGADRSDGRMTFTRGDQVLDVHWRPADTYDSYSQNRAKISPPSVVTLLGKPSKMWGYGPTDFTTIRPFAGDTFLEVRGEVGDRHEYLRVLGQLRLVDEQTWLAAMPANVVVPARQVEVIQHMVQGLQTPPGFDAESITVACPAERYHVGARITGAVTCAWIDHWRKSREIGDQAQVQYAVDAMANSRHWPILQEMNKIGGWPYAVWETADAMAAGNPQPERVLGLYRG